MFMPFTPHAPLTVSSSEVLYLVVRPVDLQLPSPPRELVHLGAGQRIVPEARVQSVAVAAEHDQGALLFHGVAVAVLRRQLLEATMV